MADVLHLHAASFFLVLSRLAGLFVFAPMISSSVVPVRVRVMLAFCMAIIVYPLVPPAPPQAASLDLASLGPAVISESLIGVAIGLIAAMPMYGVQLGGLLMGHQLGLGLGAVYNPAMDTESDFVGEMLLYIAFSVFLALGGLEAAFAAVVGTFQTVPLGGISASQAPAELISGLAASGFEVALRIAAPVLCILLLETIAMGLISKTLPQLNILSIGFAIKILAGIMVLTFALAAIEQVAGDEILRVGRLLTRWTHELAVPRGGG